MKRLETDQHIAPTPSLDLMGNTKDRAVGYARGALLAGDVQEVQRQRRAYAMIRQRFEQGGDDALFNLTGLIRGFPLQDSDKPNLPSYIHHIARYGGELESLGLKKLGGNAEEHDCFLSTRVSAGMLAIMLTLLAPGDTVLSLVVADNSHPSVSQAVRIAGGDFIETVGLEAFEKALEDGIRPNLVVVTTISPSKRHLPLEQTSKAIALARKHGALVVLDDAHMAARISLYGETPGLGLDVDATVWSLDKHMTGPRSGLVAGKKSFIRKIKARALALGLEAQLGQVLAGLHAMEVFDPERIRQAQAQADDLLGQLNVRLQGHAYLAGAGIAVAGDRLLWLAARESGKTPAIAPIEAVAYTAMRLLELYGAVTIPAIGMPGAACTYRLMLYPDGLRIGVKTLVEASHRVFDELAGVLDQPEAVRSVLLG